MFQVDALDLCAARVRATFVVQAASELRVGEETIKRDLGRVLGRVRLETTEI